MSSTTRIITGSLGAFASLPDNVDLRAHRAA